MKYIDLHVHTCYSDGILTPRQAVEYAAKAGLCAVAIVDHDNTNGIREALEAGEMSGVEVVPGVELSAEETLPDTHEVHILGYYIDYHESRFQDKIRLMRESRLVRAEKIAVKLRLLGIEVDLGKIISENKIESVGRMHIAKALLETGKVGGIPEAFDKYLSYGKPAYEPKMRLSVKEAINLVSDAGGIPVIAHPFYGVGKDEAVLQEFVSYGLKGIEVYHPKHKQNIKQFYADMANKYKLLMTGGSDCHGPINDRNIQIGSEKVPCELLEELKKFKHGL